MSFFFFFNNLIQRCKRNDPKVFKQVLATAHDEPAPAKKQSCSDRSTDQNQSPSTLKQQNILAADSWTNQIQRMCFSGGSSLSSQNEQVYSCIHCSVTSETAFGVRLEERRTSLGPQSVSNILLFIVIWI